MALQIGKYLTQKAAGTVALFKTSPKHVAASTPRYDAETGEQIDSEITMFNLESIDKDIARLTADIAALKVLRADVAAALAK